jgi:hypothetical protein
VEQELHRPRRAGGSWEGVLQSSTSVEGARAPQLLLRLLRKSAQAADSAQALDAILPKGLSEWAQQRIDWEEQHKPWTLPAWVWGLVLRGPRVGLRPPLQSIMHRPVKVSVEFSLGHENTETAPWRSWAQSTGHSQVELGLTP